MHRSLALAALLADGRFPAGGHAHSAGYEAASNAFAVSDLAGLESFIRGRLSTTGRTESVLLAATRHRIAAGTIDWCHMDHETEARIASPALRRTSRTLGRQWLRAGRRIWPEAQFDALDRSAPDGPHQVLVFAAVSEVAGLAASDAVSVHLHHLVATIATAAVRLHGADPFAVHRLQARLVASCDELAAEAMQLAPAQLAMLPATSGPLTDLLAEDHARWDTRLFQS